MKRLNQIFMLLFSAGFSLFGQMIIREPAHNSIIEQGRIAVIVAGKPGAPCRLFVNNVPADSGEIRIDGIYDFLNIEVPEGPVELRCEAIGAGNRVFKAVRQVHIVGGPDTLITDYGSIELPADSQSVSDIRIRVQDAWGYPVTRIRTATAGIRNGSVIDKDIDSLSAGHQLSVNSGELNFRIKAAGTVGREDLMVEVGDVSLSIPVRYTTPMTRFILVGSMDAAISAAEWDEKNTNEPKFTLADWTHQEGDVKDIPVSGRLAFYAKGSWLKKYQVTASFDSRRTRDNQLFRDLDPDRQYALYGDASTLMYDAQTQSKFYGKIENNESFLAIGDFNTNFRSVEFAQYDRSFNGVFSNVQLGKQTLKGFMTLNDRTMELDEIRGEGISGYYTLTASRITEYSDKIRIETRDRYHPEKILRSEEQARFADYDINYVDGTLMFKQPVPSVDANGNPMYIVAAYEYQVQSEKSLIGGIRYEGTVRSLKMGSTLILEEKNPSNYYLYGADAVLPVAKWLKLKGEYAGSSSAEFGRERETGSAYMGEADFMPFKVLELNGYYRKVEPDFLNASQTGSRFELGSEKYGTKGKLGFGRFGNMQSEFYRQFNETGTVNENHVQVANAFYEYAIGTKTTAKLGYEESEREKIGADSASVPGYGSKMIRALVSHQWNKRLSSELAHDENLEQGSTVTLPTATSLGLSYQLTEKVKLSFRERLIHAKGRSQTLFGIDSKISKGTELTGKYEIGGASGESLSRATVGLRNKWQVNKDLTLNFILESTATMDSLEVPTPEHNAISIGIEHLPDGPMKTSGKFELMQDKTVLKRVVTIGHEFRILNGLAAIALLEHNGAGYRGNSRGDVWNRSNVQLGLAYRPEKNDVFNGVAKLQFLTDKNTHAAPRTRLDRLIGTVHGYWQAHSRLELGFRLALRVLVDEETGFFSTRTRTNLYEIRSDLDLGSRWNTAMDLRIVSLSPVGQTRNGMSGEISYRFKTNMQAGVGYIIKQLSDPDFSYTEYAYSNFYLILRMKFSEDALNWK